MPDWKQERLRAQVPDAQAYRVKVLDGVEQVRDNLLHLFLREALFPLLALQAFFTHVSDLAAVEKQLGDGASIGILLHYVAMVLGLHEFFRADHEIWAQNVKRG